MKRAELVVVVERDDTAERVGSGDVPVLATPRLLAWAEAATVKASPVAEGQTSVGTRVELEHRAASPVGTRMTISAELVEADGRRLAFAVKAVDEHGTVVGEGRIERVVVDRARFLSRVGNA
ncbi:thioesterase family protein [Actinomadura rudentiformis]|uniref:Thioesterase n=1 Tax=Actinomadura rudentiformis TaxID=359158 RepID=A0A6H9YUG3_9ACTN|nr:thioesterase [Actinomadura rudentiformis]KAB2350699.1 thioesterase [Actinomadura rudentiformis]